MPPRGDNRRVGDLPVGTVTLLFSGIEGSTAMLSSLGDRYGEALSAHRTLLRAAFAACHGPEISTEGDSFFVVFQSAGEAVSCCLAAQRALASYDWAEGEAVQVRMGVHSGQPTPHEDNYIGMDVHRAARIAATAHGGQVVMSAITWQQAKPDMPAGLSVRDLGFHRLKISATRSGSFSSPARACGQTSRR
jgi:class 3 adenylate cyclase